MADARRCHSSSKARTLCGGTWNLRVTQITQELPLLQAVSAAYLKTLLKAFGALDAFFPAEAAAEAGFVMPFSAAACKPLSVCAANANRRHKHYLAGVTKWSQMSTVCCSTFTPRRGAQAGSCWSEPRPLQQRLLCDSKALERFSNTYNLKSTNHRVHLKRNTADGSIGLAPDKECVQLSS
jgi:hypothetical protein